MTTETPSTRINVMEFGGKDHLLRVVGAERAAFFDLIDQLDDAGWGTPSACVGWEVRDLAGHLVDVTEAYLERWALARAGQPFPEALGLRVMARQLDQGARRFRSVPRPELIARLKRASDELFGIFDRLDARQWTGELVPHVFMGPLPAFFYPAFQLMDYSVHRWDALQGLGRPAPLNEDAAGTLVPFMFILLQATLDADRARGFACTCGIQVAGRYGGTWRLQVADGALTHAEGEITDCPVTLSFDPSDFVLSCFQRIRGGVVGGDPVLAERFRDLFFKI